MRSRLHAVAALGAAGLVAFTVFVTFSWFRLSILPLAALALVAFWLAAFPLLRLTTRPFAEEGSRARRWVRWWMLGGTLAYVVLAQLMVGTRPAPTIVPPEPAPGTQYWALSNGSRLAYVHTPAQGARRDTPVVVVHDGPGMPALSRLQQLSNRPFDFLAGEGLDVYYYDQSGAGLSGRIDLGSDPPYTVGAHVQDLEEVRRRLGAPRLFLVGEGWGATLVTQYMLAHPDRVAKAVLESPAPVWYPAWPEFVDPVARARITDVQSSALALLQRPTPRLVIGRMMSDFNPRVAHALVADWEADQWWTRAEEEALRLGQPRLSCASEVPARLLPLSGLGFFAWSYTLRDALRLPDPRPALAAIQVPTLIIRGSCDYVDWRVSYEYLHAMPGARYVAIPAAGHLIWLDQVSLHRDVLTAFVRDEKLPLEFYDPEKVRSAPVAPR